MGKGGRITYGDGSQSKVIGKGIIDIPSLGTSQEALYHTVWTVWITVRNLLYDMNSTNKCDETR
jgi:hypothetical protein